MQIVTCQSITTKLIGQTNSKPARIMARASGGERLTVPADSSDRNYSHVETHQLAAAALCRRLGWSGTLIAGTTKQGFVFVFSNGDRVTV